MEDNENPKGAALRAAPLGFLLSSIWQGFPMFLMHFRGPAGPRWPPQGPYRNYGRYGNYGPPLYSGCYSMDHIQGWPW